MLLLFAVSIERYNRTDASTGSDEYVCSNDDKQEC